MAKSAKNLRRELDALREMALAARDAKGVKDSAAALAPIGEDALGEIADDDPDAPAELVRRYQDAVRSTQRHRPLAPGGRR